MLVGLTWKNETGASLYGFLDHKERAAELKQNISREVEGPGETKIFKNLKLM